MQALAKTQVKEIVLRPSSDLSLYLGPNLVEVRHADTGTVEDEP